MAETRRAERADTLSHLEILWRGAADGALVRGPVALQHLAADGADHRYGHRRVRGHSVLGLYLLAGVSSEVVDGEPARNNVFHRVARSGERVLDEREVYAGGASLARQLLRHVARDVPHEALWGPLEALDGVLGPGELAAAALRDERPGPLEGAVVYRALAARGPLDPLFGVGDGAATALYPWSLAARLLAVLLL